MGGKPKTTDLLLDMVALAGKGEGAAVSAIIERIRAKHLACANELLSEAEVGA